MGGANGLTPRWRESPLEAGEGVPSGKFIPAHPVNVAWLSSAVTERGWARREPAIKNAECRVHKRQHACAARVHEVTFKHAKVDVGFALDRAHIHAAAKL